MKIMEKAGGKDGIWVCPEYGREALRFTYRDGGIRLSRRLDFSGAMGDAWVTCLRETEELLNMRDYLTDKLDGQCEEAENLNKIFVERARQIVEHHLADPDMGVERLASEMNMSRSTFTRKIKSITGKTPSEFIRQIKMAYARRMVLAQDRSISEIATALGFSDRKHFTTSFKEEFGMPPTAYQKTHKDEA